MPKRIIHLARISHGWVLESQSVHPMPVTARLAAEQANQWPEYTEAIIRESIEKRLKEQEKK